MMSPPPSQVHLWCCRTDLGETEAAERRAILSGPERARADRFRVAQAGIAFVAARSWLRQVLAAYTQVPAARLRFGETASGKPFLADGDADRPVAFNLSHSGDLAIVAVTAGLAVGVDIERVRPVPPDVAAACMTPAEAAALAALKPESRDEAFIRCWTRKEACLKATGAGLNTPPSSVAVSLDPLSAQVLAVGSDAGEAARWQLADLRPAPGYCGALAARRHGWSAVWMARPEPAPAGALMNAMPAPPR
ncbi:4'-phosphopantetheinyl transferase superfamily protein [Bosea sp. (in: a-proteobacteria)]|uniref:4'-phosphopantetheinyl transferase family protein n=1 Tax=Bosea sp. (in: a-proteobacteria) TaxID=1871050 RepID=UPI002623B095|nr:4'-phosphopantetheinyl transferase superfamily protein [Bosea sp. (in: a-proteobacteria)]MCO5090980.1 4'-phosphopantetheinyl transferase superfamily protein [Bosea sp. (in: a-proteobacteria)]